MRISEAAEAVETTRDHDGPVVSPRGASWPHMMPLIPSLILLATTYHGPTVMS
jgi:hypothetical protein